MRPAAGKDVGLLDEFVFDPSVILAMAIVVDESRESGL